MTYVYRDKAYEMADDTDIFDAIKGDHIKVVSDDRRTHPRDRFTTDYECMSCKAAWPCDAAILLAAYEEAEHRRMLDSEL